MISPSGSESSNIMKLLRRAMDACGIAITDARWTYMRLFCSYCNLRGQLWRPKVARAMAVIVADDRQCEESQAGVHCQISLSAENHRECTLWRRDRTDVGSLEGKIGVATTLVKG